MPKKKLNKLKEFKLSKPKKRVHVGDSDEIPSPSPSKKEKITYPKIKKDFQKIFIQIYTNRKDRQRQSN